VGKCLLGGAGGALSRKVGQGPQGGAGGALSRKVGECPRGGAGGALAEKWASALKAMLVYIHTATGESAPLTSPCGSSGGK
jgi:hypothetical protein